LDRSVETAKCKMITTLCKVMAVELLEA